MSCRPYPDKARVVDALLEVAGRAAMESSAEHPEDVADQVSVAVEAAGVTIATLWKRGLL